jgi:hypothetical protein
MHADKVTTPLLILHGEADLRVPTFQSREFFVLLAERGKTVRLVSYPGSPHFALLAEQRQDPFKNGWPVTTLETLRRQTFKAQFATKCQRSRTKPTAPCLDGYPSPPPAIDIVTLTD